MAPKRVRALPALSPSELVDFIQVEYVDPADSMCEECQCSFGIHLMTCSKFTPHK